MASRELASADRRGSRWRLRPERMLAFVLLGVALGAATLGIVSSLEEAQWAGLWPTMLLGLALGWALGQSRVNGWVAIPLFALAGGTAVIVIGGGLLPGLARTVRELAAIALTPRAEDGVRIAITQVAQSIGRFMSGGLIVVGRAEAWGVQLARGEPAFDPVAASMAWSGAIWCASAWAGWFAAGRGDGLLAALPATAMAGATMSDAGGGVSWLFVGLAAAVLVVAAAQHGRRQQGWMRRGYGFPADIGRRVGLWALVGTLVLLVIAAFLTSSAVDRWLERRLHPSIARSAENGLSQSLGIRSESASETLPAETTRPGLPRARLLTIGPELAQTPVMTVEVESPLTDIEPGLSVPYYWRSFTYDVYNGAGWETSRTDSVEVAAGETIAGPVNSFQHTIDLIARSAALGFTEVYSGGRLSEISEPATLERRGQDDVFGASLQSPRRYRLQSIMTVASADDLRRTGPDYPSDIANRYLQVPSGVPERVRRLVIELTATASTPYDRARAVEGYLRTIPYSLEVDRPPLGQDLVDFFLFDERSGYCDYYASAMVVMARMAGIPARLAIGYSSGEYSEKTGRFLVRQADAHSWSELYFPGVGWVTFEPTAARPALDRARAMDRGEGAEATATGAHGGASPNISNAGAGVVLAGVLVMLLGVAGVWAGRGEWRLRRGDLPTTAAEVLAGIRRHGRRLGVRVHASDTLGELQNRIVDRLTELDPGLGPRSLQGERDRRELSRVVEALERVYYQPRGSVDQDGAAIRAIRREWVNARRLLRRRWLIAMWWNVRNHLAALGSLHRSTTGLAGEGQAGLHG